MKKSTRHYILTITLSVSLVCFLVILLLLIIAETSSSERFVFILLLVTSLLSCVSMVLQLRDMRRDN